MFLIQVSGYIEKQDILACDITCSDHYCGGERIDCVLCLWEKGFSSRVEIPSSLGALYLKIIP